MYFSKSLMRMVIYSGKRAMLVMILLNYINCILFSRHQMEGYIAAGRKYIPGWGNPHMASWVLKFDANGNIQWQKLYGDNYDTTVRAIEQTSDGGYILAASYVLKLDVNGNIQWQKKYYPMPDLFSYFFYSIQQTTDSGYIVAGSTEDFGAGFYSDDAWVLKNLILAISNGKRFMKARKKIGSLQFSRCLTVATLQLAALIF